MSAVALVTGVLVLALTACSDPVPVAPSVSPTNTALPAPTGDGLLRIGTMFPMTGDLAASGAAQVAGAQVAAREIDSQGGVLGQPVQLIHRNSAGDEQAALASFADRAVDAVLWDAGSAVRPEVPASVAPAALLPLNGLVNGGTPLAASEEFAKRLLVADPGLTATAGGAEAYDGVIATALAAMVTGDDGAGSIETGWVTVREGPTVCTSWGECLLALSEGQQIEYQGLTGRQS
ncbi:ABC transporter substrate-binding protein [Cryobacterium roopkundense]|uniref:Branched-chain amino acid transport system substrate-binding protein n=1 Tax=Cryobacterium roopkundense TaxID=1001240 RepID=A0A7W9E369_9MICO|nr:ABC transporter substrate-binding protein [Cryobacterium roopkundense]MBB5639595.1 branched-chain amino acid transport system substrate-binding protein [Cryobacterium roopkundense]